MARETSNTAPLPRTLHESRACLDTTEFSTQTFQKLSPFLMPILFRTTKAKEILGRSPVGTEMSLLQSSEIV